MNCDRLGSQLFCQDYKIKLAYVAGAMYKGISSKELVVRMGKANLLSFLGTGGLSLSTIEENICYIQSNLHQDAPYGMNLIYHMDMPEVELAQVELFLKYGIKTIEAAAFMQITPALVWFRFKGSHCNNNGQLIIPNRIIAKVSRPEVATDFMKPPPESILQALVMERKLSPEEAVNGKQIPMAQDICVEADSGGHTDRGVAYTLMPSIITLKNALMKQYYYPFEIRIGAAGGIGTPEAAAAAFLLGADFIVTGSINQCTIEAGTSSAVKDILQTINVQDTTYAPAGDMFEIGAKIQVVKKGLLFATRANKLYELYHRYNCLDEIDTKTLQQIQEKYFKYSFDRVWQETKGYYLKNKPDIVIDAEKNSKKKMALIFRWYFIHSTRLALKGIEEQRVDYQIHCGPALGAFNQWVKGTTLEDWRNRHVDVIGERLMEATAELLVKRYQQWFGPPLLKI